VAFAQLTARALPLVRTMTRACRRRPQPQANLLRFGKVEAGAVAAFEAGLVHLHLLAFKLAGNADHGYNDIALRAAATAAGSACGQSSPIRCGRVRRPVHLAVLDKDLAGFAGFKMDTANSGFEAVVSSALAMILPSSETRKKHRPGGRGRNRRWTAA